jgi:hypothetical protein
MEDNMDDYEQRLKQREKELEVALCFAQAAIEDLGRQKALEIIKKGWIKVGTNNQKSRFAGVPQDPPEGRLEALGEFFKKAAADRSEVKVVEASPNRVAIEISRCPTYDACNAKGLPEVCQMYCDSDYVVAREIHPRLKMVRDKVIAYGDTLCNHTWVLEE